MLMAGVAIFTTDTVVLKPKLVRRDKEGHFILIKVTIQQEGLTIVKIYVLKMHIQFHKRNTTGHKSSDRPQQNNSRQH
jgi:hypothetical protein